MCPSAKGTAAQFGHDGLKDGQKDRPTYMKTERQRQKFTHMLTCVHVQIGTDTANDMETLTHTQGVRAFCREPSHGRDNNEAPPGVVRSSPR